MDLHSPLRMDTLTWSRRVALLAATACDVPADQEQTLLREALAILAMAPSLHAPRFAALPDADRFEELLAIGACESAALALLPADAAFILSRGSQGIILASVMLDGEDEEVAAEAATSGLALLAALAGAMRHAPPARDMFSEYDRPFGGPRPVCLH
ncbi:MAG: hypothetical protein KGN34_19050 [Sphingomonadales bacterium]|nr:hypothetical protein [Sphingomonadales bacterium]